jgi:hypothetical protein
MIMSAVWLRNARSLARHWHSHLPYRSLLDFLYILYEENFVFFFISEGALRINAAASLHCRPPA